MTLTLNVVIECIIIVRLIMLVSVATTELDLNTKTSYLIANGLQCSGDPKIEELSR